MNISELVSSGELVVVDSMPGCCCDTDWNECILIDHPNCDQLFPRCGVSKILLRSETIG